jgi:hypothetical protein
MRAKREQARTQDHDAPGEMSASLGQRIRRDLVARGVSNDSAGQLARQLEQQVAAGGQDRYETLLDGAALAFRAQSEADAEAEQSSRDLQEIERMMNAFAGELVKLDETLDVLSAYVRRMRTSSSPRSDRTLH